ncbi:hypothetical protein KJF94_07280 [Pseudomonas hormoni]|uniref:Phage tail protein n=1 Tax=Pseudomonas hormoni TaxID=3093767 RepID=A0ABX8F3G5_9PSED|nr:hypothetical protein [Pseudomonas hormoni]QVW25368.1 hypothetical protein KJF94_07280 [Pseudomonas hormoni]
MSIDPINIGGAANDGNGQTLRSGGAVINANFSELDTRTTAAQAKAEQGVAHAGTAQAAAEAAQAKADAAIPGSAAGSSIAQLVNGVVPALQLPSYVDDVLEFPTLANFPATGETGKIYIAINDGDSPSNPTRQYRWSGTAFVMIPSSPGSTDQVAEGTTNLYHTAARVRSAALTGLDASINAAVVATDSVLTGIGKLQKQVSDAVVELAGKFDKTGGKLTGALNSADIVTIASSATPAIGASAANTITITGTTGITGFDSIASGAVRTLVFAGVVTLTHHATSLILPKAASITTAAGDVLQFTSLGGGSWRCTGKMLAADGGAATGGMWVGMKIAWPLSEASIPGGGLPDNGQLVDRATWPDLWALYSSQAISDATWIADPLQRGKPSTGNGTSTFRMPDTNGKYSDGLTPAAAVLRGHGKNSAGTPGLFQLDQLQAHNRSIRSGASSGGSVAGPSAAALSWVAGNTSTDWAYQTAGYLADGSNGTPRVGPETRGTNVTVVWVTVGATGVSNPGTVDVTALATSVNSQGSRIAALEASTDFIIIYPNGGTAGSPATAALNAQYISANPFPGFNVITEVEFLSGGKWYCAYPIAAGAVAGGASCGQVDDTIVVRTAITYLIYNVGGYVNSTAPGAISTGALPFRVKVWKVKA